MGRVVLNPIDLEIAEQAERAIRTSRKLIEQSRALQRDRAVAIAAIRANRAASNARMAALHQEEPKDAASELEAS